MAIVQNPIIGRAKGQAGGIVFTTQFGKNVIKAKPVSVANPQTDAQVERRAGITQVVSIYRQVAAAFKVGYASQAIGKSAYNAFSSQVLKNAMTFTGSGSPTLVPASVKTSKGSITATVQSGKEIQIPEKSVVMDYPATANGAGQNLTDKAMIVAYNATQGIWEGAVTTDTRADGQATLVMSQTPVIGDVYHLYLSFIKVDGSNASDSDYVEHTVPA